MKLSWEKIHTIFEYSGGLRQIRTTDDWIMKTHWERTKNAAIPRKWLATHPVSLRVIILKYCPVYWDIKSIIRYWSFQQEPLSLLVYYCMCVDVFELHLCLDIKSSKSALAGNNSAKRKLTFNFQIFQTYPFLLSSKFTIFSYFIQTHKASNSL